MGTQEKKMLILSRGVREDFMKDQKLIYLIGHFQQVDDDKKSQLV